MRNFAYIFEQTAGDMVEEHRGESEEFRRGYRRAFEDLSRVARQSAEILEARDE